MRHQLKILIVDDHDIMRELTRVTLEAAGMRVREACTGAEALSLAWANRYDAILMDLVMPGMTGADVVQIVRSSDGPNRTAPIIAFTAASSVPDAVNLALQGFAAVVTKPIVPRDLLSTVEAAITATSPNARP